MANEPAEDKRAQADEAASSAPPRLPSVPEIKLPPGPVSASTASTVNALHSMLFEDESANSAGSSEPKSARDAEPGNNWPSWIPSAPATLAILCGQQAPHDLLRPFVETNGAKLSELELSAVKSRSADPSAQALRDVIVVRWQLLAAVAHEPKPLGTVDGKAIEGLLAESDVALTAISQLSEGAPDAVREMLGTARASIARDAVHLAELLHEASQASALEAAATSSKKYERLAARMVSMSAADSKEEKRGSKGLWVVFAVVAVTAGVFHYLRISEEAQRPPLKTAPGAPTGTVLMEGASTKIKMLRTIDGKPPPRPAMEQFRKQSEAAGTKVQEVAPGEFALVPADQPDLVVPKFEATLPAGSKPTP